MSKSSLQRPHIYAVTRLFFDRSGVIKRMDSAKLRIYIRIGALVRKIAQQSMKPQRKKTVRELTETERQIYRKRARELQPRDSRGRLQKLPPEAREQVRRQLRSLRPWADPEPGKPPRVGLGLLQRHIYYNADPIRDEVIVGPINLPGLKAAEVLEYGGTHTVWSYFKRRKITATFRAFPYMRPALARARARYAELFRNALVRSRI